MTTTNDIKIPEGLVYLPVYDLHPHPDNPRRDIGDVSELAESIRANGIYQNLTVVPNMRVGEVTGEVWQCGYMVIIGHRRLAAAKLAGLKEVPCVIRQMTYQEQLRTMLMENMQRSDLTIYEQAQGFQMMLDLGESVESIARDSGFSQSTVRRRVKLLSLDAEKLKASEARGATLQDYMELDKLKDPERKNAALETIGTGNFKNTLKRLLEEEKAQERLAVYIAELEKFAERIEEKGEAMDFVKNYHHWNNDEVKEPWDSELVGYYYTVSPTSVTLYRDHQEEVHVETAEEREKKQRAAEQERIGAELKAIRTRCFECRRDFIDDFTNMRKHMNTICRMTIYAQTNAIGYPDMETAAELLYLKIEASGGAGISYHDFKDCLNNALKNEWRGEEDYVLLALSYAMLDNEQNGYFDSVWSNQAKVSVWEYRANDKLDVLYDFLVELGYQMSDEERDMMNGRHPLLAGLEADA